MIGQGREDNSELYGGGEQDGLEKILKTQCLLKECGLFLKYIIQ